jgi:hypothetical protein
MIVLGSSSAMGIPIEIFNICLPLVKSEKDKNQIIRGWTTGNSCARKFENIPKRVFFPVAGST